MDINPPNSNPADPNQQPMQPNEQPQDGQPMQPPAPAMPNDVQPAPAVDAQPAPQVEQAPVQPQPMAQPVTAQMPAQPVSSPQPAQPQMPAQPGTINQTTGKSKKPFIILGAGLAGLVLLAILAIAVLKFTGSGVSLVEYTGSSFTILQPEDWKADEATNSVSFKENTVDGEDNEFIAELSVGVGPDDATADEFSTSEKAFESYRKLIDDLKANQPSDGDNFVVSGDFTESEINGYKVLVYNGMLKNVDGKGEAETGEGKLALIYKDNENIAVVGMSGHESDSKYLAKFMQIVESFKFTN